MPSFETKSHTTHIRLNSLFDELNEEEVNHFRRLETINQLFYTRYADEFHSSRAYGWRGWLSLLDLLPQHPLNVIDLGCGGGRLLQFLERRWVGERKGHIHEYLGADREEQLLDHARQSSCSLPSRWVSWDWSVDPITLQHFHREAGADWVTLFGVIHHIYHPSVRARLISQAGDLLRSGGILSVSLWDFGAQARYQDKSLSWAPLIEEGTLPHLILPGDTLLGWRGQTSPPRYCHWLNPGREAQLIADVQSLTPHLTSPMLITHPQDGNRYLCWTRR